MLEHSEYDETDKLVCNARQSQAHSFPIRNQQRPDSRTIETLSEMRYRRQIAYISFFCNNYGFINKKCQLLIDSFWVKEPRTFHQTECKSPQLLCRSLDQGVFRYEFAKTNAFMTCNFIVVSICVWSINSIFWLWNWDVANRCRWIEWASSSMLESFAIKGIPQPSDYEGKTWARNHVNSQRNVNLNAEESQYTHSTKKKDMVKHDCPDAYLSRTCFEWMSPKTAKRKPKHIIRNGMLAIYNINRNNAITLASPL